MAVLSGAYGEYIPEGLVYAANFQIGLQSGTHIPVRVQVQPKAEYVGTYRGGRR